MPLTKLQLARDRQTLRQLATCWRNKANCCSVGGDETRLKILHLLKSHGKLSGGDLAQTLGVTHSAVSHQLALLERFDFVVSERHGKAVHYALNTKNKSRQINCLLNLNS